MDISPEGFYEQVPSHGLGNIYSEDVNDDKLILHELGIVPPVQFMEVPIAPGEALGDFTRRMYGANTSLNRNRILAANFGKPLKGTVNVPV